MHNSGGLAKSYWFQASVGSHEGFGNFEGHAAVQDKARRAYPKQPDTQGLVWVHTRRGSSIPALRETIGQTLLYKTMARRALVLGPRRASVGKKRTYFAKKFVCVVSFVFRHDHPFLQFPDILDSTSEYIQRRDALITRRVLEATILDRDILTQAGL
ncbi:hypothetical protein L2E82_04261 [Cichorium intybus]|uniref:Uncharacterized protein n=1 Tax=Cichorium intybus TaxID=13427 RepID=A0ACB9H6I4_CICIN|nr:hypothetical protein L2E82_04261 [Cichorium intybus]